MVVKCLIGFAWIGAILYLTPAFEEWLRAEAKAVVGMVLQECDPPDEGEILLVSVVNRGGRLVGVGCQRVGSPGSYAKEPKK